MGLPQEEGRLGWLSDSSRVTVLQSKEEKRWCGLGLLREVINKQEPTVLTLAAVLTSREKHKTLDELQQTQG